MVTLHQLICLILIQCLVLLSLVDCKMTKEKCETCKEIVDNFHKQLDATAKSNFGGGNTNWEENSLKSPYAHSETRMVEIMEKICSSSECHTMLEKHEHIVEDFWFKEFAKNNNRDIHTFLCIENAKVCCPNNTFGKSCDKCPGDGEKQCNGNGKCDGDGTRAGTGKCKCNSGYTGDICTDCKPSFYKEMDGDTVYCKVCDISCKKECTGAGPKACAECKDGWIADEAEGCLDVNECTEEPCEDDQYCVNTRGNYSCFSCNDACISCTGSGDDKCINCKEGYERLESGKCQDKDECTLDSSLCSKEHEECVNTPGSYECICGTGYEYKDAICIKSAKADNNTSDTNDEKDDDNDDEEDDDNKTNDKEEL